MASRQAVGGYMEWPAAPRWMEPLLADEGGSLVTVSRLANADLERLQQGSGGNGGSGRGGGLRREDLRYPVAPRGKYQAASGAFPQNEGDDMLIPGDGKTVYMACGQPSKYLARRRKLPPRLADNGVLSFNYEGSAVQPCADAATVAATAADSPANKCACRGARAPDVSSVTGRHYSRRRMIPQPEGFFHYQGQPVAQSSKTSLQRATFGSNKF